MLSWCRDTGPKSLSRGSFTLSPVHSQLSVLLVKGANWFLPENRRREGHGPTLNAELGGPVETTPVEVGKTTGVPSVASKDQNTIHSHTFSESRVRRILGRGPPHVPPEGKGPVGGF